MIPRSLVPFDASPPALEPTARRRPSTLDDRTLVPAGLAPVPLETKSSIPANLPLESIAERFVVPRDVNPEAYQREEASALPPQPTDLDERITIPLGATSPEVIPPPAPTSEELVEKNILLTGEVNFLANEEIREKQARKNLIDRAYSVVLHVAVILLLIFQPKLFSRRPPTAAEQEIARKQMVLLLPPGAFDTAPPAPRVVTPPPKVKVDPRVLRQIAPPEPTPAPQPVQPRVEPKELPSAPTPQPNSTPPPPAPTPKQEIASNAPVPKLETPDAPAARPNLTLPKTSSNTLRDTLRDMSSSGRPSAPTAIAGGGQLPSTGGGGSRQGTAYGAMELLTPTEGVDFRDYLARVYTTVKQNWFAVMPESVRLGDKGVVSLQFKIMKDGSVPPGQPFLVLTSQKEPLDRAAVSSVRASNPFEPLPSEFKGPYIELRFTYYYNLPIDYAK